MSKLKVCIRVDIDTIKDTQVLPIILELLDFYKYSATFFVTSGYDMTYKNYKHYVNPLKLFKKKSLQQHGIKQMFNGLFSKQQVQKSKNIQLILSHSHELGLHGYNHYNWMNHLLKSSYDVIESWFIKGIELFEKEYCYTPKSFASPGFTVSSTYLEVLDTFDFHYASDFRGEKEFYPYSDIKEYNTLQIPVASKSLGELEAENYTHAQIYNKIVTEIENADNFYILYMHPSYEPILTKNILLNIFDYIQNQKKIEIIKMEKLAHILKGDIN